MSVIKDFFQDKLRVTVFDSREEMGREAGKQAAACIRLLQKERPQVNMIFAAAPSQDETLAALIAAEGIDWRRVNAFHMDEYVGLASSHPACFRNYLNRTIFEKLPFGSVHLIDGNAADPEEECRRYSELLAKYPADVCLLGVGENGHLAFNDPPIADFCDPDAVKIVELEERCRRQQVHDGCFEKLDLVPTHAITVTIPALVRAGYMFCSVPGATKRDAVAAMLTGAVDEQCPASILRMHGNAVLYLDRDSAAGIAGSV